MSDDSSGPPSKVRKHNEDGKAASASQIERERAKLLERARVQQIYNEFNEKQGRLPPSAVPSAAAASTAPLAIFEHIADCVGANADITTGTGNRVLSVWIRYCSGTRKDLWREVPPPLSLSLPCGLDA